MQSLYRDAQNRRAKWSDRITHAEFIKRCAELNKCCELIGEDEHCAPGNVKMVHSIQGFAQLF